MRVEEKGWVMVVVSIRARGGLGWGGGDVGLDEYILKNQTQKHGRNQPSPGLSLFFTFSKLDIPDTLPFIHAKARS